MNLTLNVSKPEDIANLITYLNQDNKSVCEIITMQEGVSAIKIAAKMPEPFLITLISDQHCIIKYHSPKYEGNFDEPQLPTSHVVPPSQAHDIDYPAHVFTETLFFILDATLPEMTDAKSKITVFELAFTTQTQQLLNQVFQLSVHSQIEIKATLYALLNSALTGVNVLMETPNSAFQSKNALDLQKIQLVARLITKDFSVAIPSIDELALQVNMSKSKLKTVFARIYGKSLYSYYMDMRFNRAKELLAAKEYRVNEVSMMVGYENVTKFVETFRKRYGTTPKRFA